MLFVTPQTGQQNKSGRPHLLSIVLRKIPDQARLCQLAQE